jgi:glycine dehydrogenase subunit 1
MLHEIFTRKESLMVVHKFLPNSDIAIAKIMLQHLGLKSVEDLYSDVPDELRLRRPLNVPDGVSDLELERLVEAKLGRNMSSPECLNFLGGGIWQHYVPAIIDEILSRGEFYTAYTPYQPEISQGMLQGLFEYQSQICELTGMEVCNSSMYDWGTALGEAGRMAHRINGRTRILVSRAASPERAQILNTYCYPTGIELQFVDHDISGRTNLESLESSLTEQVSALYLESPNFFGVIEDKVHEIVEKCHSKGILVIMGVNPMTLGILKPPGEYGADIVVGDGQPLGSYLNFGGPLIGIFATKRDPALLRQMPGRLIGMTTSKDNLRRGYTMVLQTREQHIRRENATSNICTNEALFALAVSVYLSALGPKGIKKIGESIVTNSHYAMKLLSEAGLRCPYFEGRFFGDLSLKTRKNSSELANSLAKKRILGGISLGRWYPRLDNVSVFSFTELHTQKDVETLASVLAAEEVGP